jgi:hypothetical protein
LIPTRSCLWFSKVKQRCDPFFSYLNFINESGKSCDLFDPYLNFINKSGTESRCILPNLNFYESLIPTRSFLWFLKGKEMWSVFFSYWNFLNEIETESVTFFPYLISINYCRVEPSQDSFYHTKFLQVIDPHRIMSLVFESKKEMWSVSSVIKLYKHEWNRVKIHFTIPKYCDQFFPFLNIIIESGTGSRFILPYLNLQVVDPYWIMSLVFESETEMWSVFFLLKLYQ